MLWQRTKKQLKLEKQMAGLEAEQLGWYVHQPHCRCMLCMLQLEQHTGAQDCHSKLQQLPRPRATTRAKQQQEVQQPP